MVGISGAGLSLTDRGDPRIKAEVESLDAIHEFIACKITVSLDGFGSTLYSATCFQPYFLPSESHPCCCQKPQRPSKLLFLIDLNKKRSLTSPLPSREYDEANPHVNPDFRSISPPAGTIDFTRVNSVLRLSASPP